VPLGDDEAVALSERVNVQKSQREIVFVNAVGGCFAGDDIAKDAGLVSFISHAVFPLAQRTLIRDGKRFLCWLYCMSGAVKCQN
jgi:hypothetical protein